MFFVDNYFMFCVNNNLLLEICLSILLKDMLKSECLLVLHFHICNVSIYVTVVALTKHHINQCVKVLDI